MSSREPMWYCHECNAEMRPLMTPEPVCASCRGAFVEKMEDSGNDPREFHNVGQADFGDIGLGPLGLLASINEILRSSSPSRRDATTPQTTSPSRDQPQSPFGSGNGLRFEFGTPASRRTLVFGGPQTMNRMQSDPDTRTPGGPPQMPRLSDFLRQNSASSDGSNGPAGPRDLNIPGQLMAQYLLAMLGGGTRGGGNFFGPLGFFGPEGGGTEGTPGGGRWGDYVFTQEALDEIITQMMEASNTSRPVPATDEVMEKLPREVIMENNPLLENDCAVCKEQFSATAEDADEQVVVTLPCKHPFHEGCIIPWLKSSGTCPVCRYALVPQPNGHAQASGSTSPGRPSSESRSTSRTFTFGGPRSESPAQASPPMPTLEPITPEPPRPEPPRSDSSRPATQDAPANAGTNRQDTRDAAPQESTQSHNSPASRASGFFGSLISHGMDAFRHGQEAIRHNARNSSPQRQGTSGSTSMSGSRTQTTSPSRDQRQEQPPGRATSPRRRGESGAGPNHHNLPGSWGDTA